MSYVSCKESLGKKDINSVIWVKSNDQLVDCLTKEGASPEKNYVMFWMEIENSLKKEKRKKWQTGA